MEIRNISNGEYGVGDKLFFDTEDGKLEMKAVDALEIAYTLFDWAGFDYRILDALNEKVEG